MAAHSVRTTDTPPDLDLRHAGRFGAVPQSGGVRFRVLAPAADLRLHVLTGAAAGVHAPATVVAGVAEFFVPGAAAGDRYAYSIGGGDLRPDPASRHQPDGVHAPSEVIEGAAYRWRSSS